MKLTKVLETAASSGIHDLILTYGVSSSLEVTFSQGEHDNTTIANDFQFAARGGIDGHLVSFKSDTLDNKTVDLMIQTMLDQKNYSQPYDSDLIIAKPEIPYGTCKAYFPQIKKLEVADLMKIAKEVSDTFLSYDPRLVNAEVSVSVSSGNNEFLNSKNLNLKSKFSYLVVSIEGIAEDEDETVSDYIVKAFTNVKKVKPVKIAKELADQLLATLHGKTGIAGTKVCLLKPKALNTVIGVVLHHLSMFSIDQKMSLLAGKLDEKVFSELLTIEEQPNTNDIFSTVYDDEGYPTSNKVLIDQGVVKTYLYDQEMGKKYHHAPTGNGYGSSLIHPGISKYAVKTGDQNEKDLIKDIQDGYIITSLTGDNAGIDHQTGGFTLSAAGFYVKNGRIKFPVNQFTIGGDVLSLLNNIVGIADSATTLLGGNSIPAILIKDIVVSC